MKKLIVVMCVLLVTIPAMAQHGQFAAPEGAELDRFPIKTAPLTQTERNELGLTEVALEAPEEFLNFFRSLREGRFVLEILPAGTQVLVDKDGAVRYKSDCGNRLVALPEPETKVVERIIEKNPVHMECPNCPEFPSTATPDQIEELKGLINNLSQAVNEGNAKDDAFRNKAVQMNAELVAKMDQLRKGQKKSKLVWTLENFVIPFGINVAANEFDRAIHGDGQSDELLSEIRKNRSLIETANDNVLANTGLINGLSNQVGEGFANTNELINSTNDNVLANTGLINGLSNQVGEGFANTNELINWTNDNVLANTGLINGLSNQIGEGFANTNDLVSQNYEEILNNGLKSDRNYEEILRIKGFGEEIISKINDIHTRTVPLCHEVINTPFGTVTVDRDQPCR